jgi:acetyl esterase
MKPFSKISLLALGCLATRCVLAAPELQNADDSSNRSRAASPSREMSYVLDVYQLIAGMPITELSPQDARQQFSAEDAAKIVARVSKIAEAPQPVAKVTDGLMIPGPAGPLPVRIYTPSGMGPFPVVTYFHGGGFVIATIDTYDASARAIAESAGAIVVSVEYRKAPENPFPAALDDAIAAYGWVVNNASTFNGDSSKIAVAGESAGGNLATEICLHARSSGLPMPVYQLLIYPVTDFNISYPSDKTYYHAQPLNTPGLVYFTQNYLPNSSDSASPNASPLKATLIGLPPATLIAAEIDPLLDEGAAYAKKLEGAGVNVHYRFYRGVTHEFFGMGAVLDAARTAEAAAGADLKAAFASAH